MRIANRCLVGASLGLLALACTSTTQKKSTAVDDPNAPVPAIAALAAPAPWTDRFQKAAVLVAIDVRIEGPKGLLDHVVTRHEPESHDVKVEATPSGLLQTIQVKDPAAGTEIRAQLDNLAISALRRLTVLERPGPVDVLVLAAGDAYWREVEGGKEERGQSLRLEGRIPR